MVAASSTRGMMISRRRSIHGLLALTAILASACASGRMPSASSQRPLQMPDGEHQIVVEAGAIRASTDREISLSINRLSYHYGITDAVTYVFPAGVSYGGLVADDLELAVYGGLTGLAMVPRPGPAYSGDPRLLPPRGEDQLLLSASLGGSARRVLSGSSALTAEAAISPWASATRVSFLRVDISAGYVVDLASWLSASVAVGAVGGPGFATWGVSKLEATYLVALSPTLAFHLSSVFDLLLAAGSGVRINDGATLTYGHLGFDLHFD